jgi:heat shock protein HslJ
MCQGGSGRVFGSGSCNRYSGNAELSGETLSFSAIGSTMMACPEAIMAQERRFFDALGAVTGFEINDTGALLLRGASGTPVTARAVTDGSDP